MGHGHGITQECIAVEAIEILAWKHRLDEILQQSYIPSNIAEALEELRDFLDDTYQDGTRVAKLSAR